MVILTVFKRNIKVFYKTTLVSKASFLVLIFWVFTVVLPFMFAYKSRGFWLKRDTFYETPDVKFKGEYYFLATTTNVSHPLICGSIAGLNVLPGHLDHCATIKVREVDGNLDNKMDRLFINLETNLPENTDINSINLMILLDYKLHTVCPFHMQSPILYQTFLPIALSEYSLFGDLELYQSGPLTCPSKLIDTTHNKSIIHKTEEQRNLHRIEDIVEEISKSNVSVKLANIYASFKTGRNKDQFSLNLKIRYPEQKVYYRPGFWQVLKWAWIQYLAIYVILAWLIGQIKSYIFNKRMVLFYEDNPLKKYQ